MLAPWLPALRDLGRHRIGGLLTRNVEDEDDDDEEEDLENMDMPLLHWRALLRASHALAYY